MIRVVVLLVLAGVALSPAVAEAQSCACDIFVKRFTTHAGMRKKVDDGLITARVLKKDRRKFKKGIYDWEQGGYTRKNWCQRHPRMCKAAAICIAAAGARVIVSLYDGKITGEEWRLIAADCASAAGIYLVWGIVPA